MGKKTLSARASAFPRLSRRKRQPSVYKDQWIKGFKTKPFKERTERREFCVFQNVITGRVGEHRDIV